MTIGAPGNAFDGDCAPFGCAVAYQQVYGNGQFSGPISITALTFFNNNFVPGSIAAANYTLSLSTTKAAVDGLSATLASNLGADSQVFFSGALGGSVGLSNQFTVTGSAFTYNPASGNLLLTVTSNGVGQDYSIFLDYLSGAASGTFSRAYSFDTSGIASAIESDTGLVTQFTYSAGPTMPPTMPTAVPEPSALMLVGTGSLAYLLSRQKR